MCICRIRDLDAILEIMEDIRKLENIRGIVGNFEKLLRVDEEKSELHEALVKRVTSRLDLLANFRIRIHNEPVRSALHEMTENLVVMLKSSAAELGPAIEWVDLAPAEMQDRI